MFWGVGYNTLNPSAQKRFIERYQNIVTFKEDDKPMKIEAGCYYKDGLGHRIGPIVWDNEIGVWRRKGYKRNTGDYWHKDGRRYSHVADDLDLISEWPSSASPVRMGAKRDIVPGVYGAVVVRESYAVGVNIKINQATYDASMLRAAAATLIELADALEEG